MTTSCELRTLPFLSSIYYWYLKLECQSEICKFVDIFKPIDNTNEQVTATEWHSISIWEKNAINYAKQYLKKGSQVYVEGKLETNKWQDQNGNDRYTTQVVLRPYIGKLIGLTRVDQELKNEPDMPNEKIAFKDVDNIDLGDIPF